MGSYMCAAHTSPLLWLALAWLGCAAFSAGVLLPMAQRLPVRGINAHWLLVAALGGPLTILFVLGSHLGARVGGGSADG